MCTDENTKCYFSSQYFSSTIAVVLITLLPKALIKLPPCFPWSGSAAVIDKEGKIWNGSLVSTAPRYRTEKESSQFCWTAELLPSTKYHQMIWRQVFVTQLLLKGKIIYGIYTFCLLFLLWASLGDWRILYICKGMLHWCWVKRQKGKQTQFNIVIWHRDCTAFLWHPKSLCPLSILVTPDCQTEIMHIFLFSHCLSAENHWYLWWIHHKTTFSNILSKYECFQQFPCLLPW